MIETPTMVYPNFYDFILPLSNSYYSYSHIKTGKQSCQDPLWMLRT